MAHQAAGSTSTLSFVHPGTTPRLGYDANGNLVSDGVRTYTYDQEGDGRILSATLPGGGAAIYRYDPFGRRYSKTVNGTTTVYLHDEQDREVAEFDGASGALLRYYIYAPGSTAPAARVEADGVTTSFDLFDRVGSVVGLVSSAGALSSQSSYLAFGQGTGPNGGPPAGTSFGYAGYRWDDETGLYHARARYYDPRLGRWLQPDPIRQSGGVNLYAYVGNDPLNLVDPLGQSPSERANVARWGLLGAVVGSVCAVAEPCGGAAVTAIGIGAGAVALGTIVYNATHPDPALSQAQQPQQPQSPADLLAPGGVPIGTPNGKDETIRNVPGGEQAAQDLYGKLSQGGTPANPPSYPGTGVTLPGGGFVGIRPGSASKSGVPAIDLNIPGLDIGKIHFP